MPQASIHATGEELKGQREAARDAARRLFAHVDGLSVPGHANVLPLADGGAFVEAILWVPQAAIDDEGSK